MQLRLYVHLVFSTRAVFFFRHMLTALLPRQGIVFGGFSYNGLLLREFPAKRPLKKSRGFNLALILIPFFCFRNYTICRFRLCFSVYKSLGFPSIKLWVLAHHYTSSVLKLIFSPCVRNFCNLFLFSS